MANFSKAFNFRGGLQVDEDVLVVRGANVGIGSTIPNERLVVGGNIVAKSVSISDSGVSSIPNINATGVITAKEFTDGIVSIQSGIVTDNTGIVTYYGDGRFLQGLPTSQWLDVDVGLGFTSIYAAGFVGVATNDPRYVFQVGGVPFATQIGPPIPQQDGVGITSEGQIYASGIVSTRGGFIGSGGQITNLNASNVTTGQLPSGVYGPIISTQNVTTNNLDATGVITTGNLNSTGVITANTVVAPSLIGIASTAIDIVNDSNITVAILTATQKLASEVIRSGDDITTPYGNLGVKNIGLSTVYSFSQNSNSVFAVGNGTTVQSEETYGILGYGNINPLINTSFDLVLQNYYTGGVDFVLHGGDLAGINTGDFRWIYGQNNSILASLTYEGIFTLNEDVTEDRIKFTVAGLSTFQRDLGVSNDLFVGNDLNIENNVSIGGTLDAGVIRGDLTVDQANVRGEIISQILPSPQFSSLNEGAIRSTDTISVYLNSVPPTGDGVVLDSAGNITATGTINTLNLTATEDITTKNLTIGTSLTGPGGLSLSSTDNLFRIDDIFTTNVTTDTLSVNETSSFGQEITFFSLVSSDTNISINNGSVSALNFDLKPGGNFSNITRFDAEVIDASEVTLTKNLQITGVCTYAPGSVLDGSGLFSASFNEVSTNELSGINNPDFIQGPNQFTVGILTVGEQMDAASLKVNNDTFTNGSNETFRFTIATDPNRLQIQCSNEFGTITGVINLPFGIST